MAQEKVIYFAYGSNMLQARIFDRVGPTEVMGTGVLPNQKLFFSKPSIKSKKEGRADIQPKAGSHVEGVLYLLTPEQVETLDGFKGGYRRENVRVHIQEGKEVEAMTYKARRAVQGLQPSKSYLADLLTGAEENGLSGDYIRFLAAHETV